MPYIATFTQFAEYPIKRFLALILPFSWWLTMGNKWVKFLEKRYKNGTREYLDQHKDKHFTPTMGGIFILLASLTGLLFAKINYLLLLFVANISIFSLIGLWDDYSKIKHKKGISSQQKALLQLLASLIFGLIYCYITHQHVILLPFGIKINSLLAFLAWFSLLMLSATNAVNLTDGLDGLATTTLIPVLALFAFISYKTNPSLAIYTISLIGSCLGFLWYNSYPAQLFMGDVGSLGLGAALAFLAISCKEELLLILAGGVFVLETLSVIIQVLYYKKTKKRLFKMAPFHHHLELNGWRESKITFRAGTISALLCILSYLIHFYTT